MFNFFKTIAYNIFNYKSYRNSKKLYSLLHNGNYHDAATFIENNKIIFNNSLIEQWVSNVYATSNGAPISNQASKFNNYFMQLAKDENNQQVVHNYIKTFNYSPAILNINTNSIEFRHEAKQTNRVPYSQYNIQKITKWLIAECTLNGFIEKYPHMIVLLNQKFNIEDTYPVPNHNSEVFKLFVSVFYKEMKNNEEKKSIKEQTQNPIKYKSYFDFSTDFTNLPISSQIILNEIKKTLENWDWKTALNYDSFTEESHQLDRFLTHQINFCIQQYVQMPKEFHETMRNHEGLNMSEILESNLKNILLKIQEIKSSIIKTNAEKLLFNQTVQKTMLANQRNGE